jgi:hypothetical protein
MYGIIGFLMKTGDRTVVISRLVWDKTGIEDKNLE